MANHPMRQAGSSRSFSIADSNDPALVALTRRNPASVDRSLLASREDE
jgi:hypothetical protein